MSGPVLMAAKHSATQRYASELQAARSSARLREDSTIKTIIFLPGIHRDPRQLDSVLALGPGKYVVCPTLRAPKNHWTAARADDFGALSRSKCGRANRKLASTCTTNISCG
jgi:hypothetical protein